MGDRDTEKPKGDTRETRRETQRWGREYRDAGREPHTAGETLGLRVGGGGDWEAVTQGDRDTETLKGTETKTPRKTAAEPETWAQR